MGGNTTAFRNSSNACSTRRAPLQVVSGNRSGVFHNRGPYRADEVPVATSKLRTVRMSAHKVRRVLDVIRGKTYQEALQLLVKLPHRSVVPITQCLSAAALAAKNKGYKKTSLIISRATADEGTVMKRVIFRSKGRPNKILKPTCHIDIGVYSPDEPEP